MKALALLISTIVIVEILVIIGICIWQVYKDDIQWYIYTLRSGRE